MIGNKKTHFDLFAVEQKVHGMKKKRHMLN